ncbi:hypothetical protein [Serratia proteamaculans]|uniref:hypothetical protein n=1 Tax=Serratia proteamaculans TaxID=28151 RepID=UPI001020F4BA|nr:hypothetical protein [Serratia proteamaculans]RYM47371.1 hypothetical protein BSQ97_24815 [Serratia proteamaculans]
MDKQNIQQPWNGEGLPPVGTVCILSGINEVDEDNFNAYKHCSLNLWRNGQKVEVIAHKNMGNQGVKGTPVLAVWNIDQSEASGILNKYLSPFRTPEQIEAERRERITLNMLQCMPSSDEIDYAQCVRFYDAIRAGKIEGVKIDG